MRRAWREWVAFWDRREPATALALVRIAIAVVMLVDYLWVAHLGLVHAVWSPPPDGFGGVADIAGPTAYGLVVGSLFAIGIGLATPVACIVFALASAQLATIAPVSENASDVLLRIVAVILALSRCNARWSIDAWVMKKLGRPMSDEVPAWPRYLILFQVVWMYFSGGQNKSSAEWGPFGGFTALANALLDPSAGRLPQGFVLAIYPLTRVATALTMVFEWGAPIFLLAYLRGWTKIRWIWIALFFSFEIGIAIGLKIGAFSYTMLALSPVLLTPEELQRLFQRLKTRAPANRASSPS